MVQMLWAVEPEDACLPFGYVGRSRQLGECSGYTKHHLPENNPEFPRNEEASPASLEARIAFSSLAIRSLLK